ncbi:hypothetical protein TNCV_494721 [Trichonephila clavipes]|nr:hypothetical protein TNCV_494721 [Trichonephila clavipes]
MSTKKSRNCRLGASVAIHSKESCRGISSIPTLETFLPFLIALVELRYWNSLQLVGYSRLDVFRCPKMMSLEGLSQVTKALDVRRLPAQLKTLKRVFRENVRTGYKQRRGENEHISFKTSPLSLDLALCDFRIFPELACHCQGRRFQIADEIKSAPQAELKDMAKNGFQKCLYDLY